MFNLTSILTYLQTSIPTTHDLSPNLSFTVPTVPSANYMVLPLILVTAIVVFSISKYHERRKQDQKQHRLAALEIRVVGIEGRLLPVVEHCRFLDEDDDFKLPPAAYEIHKGIPEG